MRCYRTLDSDSRIVILDREGSKMPLFFYLPAIVWMGLVAVVLDATKLDERNDAQRIPDPADLTMNGSVIRFRLPLAN